MSITTRVVNKEFKAAYQMGIVDRLSTLSNVSYLDPFSLEALFGKVLVSGFMTLTDRSRIKSILLSEEIREDHLAIINRLLYGVRRGFIKLVLE